MIWTPAPALAPSPRSTRFATRPRWRKEEFISDRRGSSSPGSNMSPPPTSWRKRPNIYDATSTQAASFARIEEANAYSEHGRVFGAPDSLERAATSWRELLAAKPTGMRRAWIRYNLAINLHDLGARTEGALGVQWLSKAATHYRAALRDLHAR